MGTSRRPKGEGSIHRRADRKWVGRFYYEDPVTGLARRAQVVGATKKEVSGKLREMVSRVDAGSAARDDTTTFGVFAARWLESSLPASDRKATTKVLYAGLPAVSHHRQRPEQAVHEGHAPSSVERFVDSTAGEGPLRLHGSAGVHGCPSHR